MSLTRDDQDNYICRGFAPFGVELGAEPELDLRRATLRLLQTLEPELRAHPDQWHVMQPIFGPPMTWDEAAKEARRPSEEVS